jgi:hypothetical protein
LETTNRNAVCGQTFLTIASDRRPGELGPSGCGDLDGLPEREDVGDAVAWSASRRK